MRKTVASIIALAALLSVTGCEYYREAGANFEKGNTQADDLSKKLAPKAQLGGVIHGANPMLGAFEAESEHGDPLPSRCARPVTLQKAAPTTLAGLKELITAETGIPVEIDPRVYNDPDDKIQPTPAAVSVPSSDRQAAQQAIQQQQGQSGFPFMGRPPASAGAPTVPSVPLMPSVITVEPNFHGSCDEVFDQIAGIFDLSWRMNGRTLSFDKYVTFTVPFRISDASSKTSASLMAGGNNAQSGGAGGTGTGSSNQGGQTQQMASYEINSDIWKEIDEGLRGILPRGSRYTISRTAGFATVITTPRVKKDVMLWADQMNAVLGATVQVDVTAIYITVNDGDNYGLDVSALYKAGTNGGLTAGLSGLLPSLATTGGSASVGILAPTGGGNNFNTHFAGSQIYLNAVTQSQHNADLRTATAIGRNGMPVPINLSTDQDIVRSLTNAVGLQYGTTSVTAQTSTINYGFSLTVLPRIVAPGVVNLFLSFTANDLTNLQNFQIGTTGTVELATIDNRTIWTEMPIKSGQTLVMAGTEQYKTQKNAEGIGTDFLVDPLGSQRIGSVARTRLILLATPAIVAIPK